MATYGEFETYRDLSRGQYVVSAAKRRGKDGFVVKAFVIDERIRTKEEAQAAAKRFLSRVKAMRAAADAKKSKHWAPVYEAKMVPTGAFYATDRYQSSAQKLIAGRTRLDGPGMWAIVHSVYEGLRELQSAAGRPHGSLTPANVLISSVANLPKAKIVLADPAAEEDLDPGMGELVDLRALGRLIYSLVFFQEFRELGGWPLGESPEWDKLGKQARQWQSLCNQLLDPNVRPGSMTLESIASDFPKPEGGGGVPGWAKVASVLLLLGGAGAGIAVSGVGSTIVKQVQGLFASGGPVEEEDEDGPVAAGVASAELWRQWCEVWVAWFDEVHAWAKRVPPEEFASDETLAKVLGEAVASGNWDELDPSVVGGGLISTRGVSGGLEAYKADPSKLPREPQGLDSAEGAARAARAVGRIKEIGEGLSAENWGAHARLRRASQRFESLGWSGAAAEVQRMIGPLSTLDDGSRVEEAIKSTIKAGPVLDGIEAKLAAIEEARGRLSAMEGAEVLRLDALVASAGANASGSGVELLEGLQLALEQRRSALQQLEGPLRSRWGGAVSPRLISEAGATGADGSAPPQPGTLAYMQRLVFLAQTLETDSQQLARTDARQGWDAMARVGQLRSRRQELEPEVPAGSDAASRLSGYGSAIATVQNEIATIGTLPLETDAQDEEIRRRMRAVDDELASISGGLDRLGAELATSFESYERELRGRTGVSQFGSRVVNEAWVTQRDALLARFDSAADLPELRARVSDLENSLAAIENAVSGEPNPRGVSGMLARDQFEQVLRTQRERALVGLVAQASFELGRSRGGDASEASSWGPAQAYASWVADSEELFRDYGAAALLLSECRPLDASVADSRAIGAAVEHWQADPTRLAYGEAFTDLEGRVGEIERIGLMTDSAALRGLAEDLTRVPVAFAAWRRLGELEAWPSSVAEIQTELNLISLLRVAADRIDAAGRRVELVSELDRGGRARWGKAFSRAASVSQAEAIARLAGQFGAEDAGDGLSGLGDVLTPDAAYNLLTIRLRADVQAVPPGAGNDAQRETLVGTYLDRVRALGPGSNRERSAWLSKLEESLEEGSFGAGAFGEVALGPYGWTPETDGNRVVYRKTDGSGRDLSVEFVRLEPEDFPTLREPVYIATREVSVELFDAVADDRGGWSRLNTDEVWFHLGPAVSDPLAGYSGIRAWRVDPSGGFGGIEPNIRWYSPDKSDRFRQETFGDDATRRALLPKGSDPMQSLPATAAAEWSAMIGCRLPTPEEWQAALASERQTVQGGNWHLRGPAFAAQRERVKAAMDARGRSTEDPLMYPDDTAFPGQVRRLNIPEFKTGAEAGVRSDGSGDRWLFEPVSGSRGAEFHHLIGNVAEYVARGSGASAEYFVIGGSALSAPELPLEEAIGPIARAPRYYFSDVGFRPAFSGAGISAESRPLEERLARVVQTPALVLGGS